MHFLDKHAAELRRQIIGFSPEVMGAGQYGPPAPSLWQQWWNS